MLNPFSHLGDGEHQQLSMPELQSILTDHTLTPATLKQAVDPSWIPAPHLQFLSNKIATGIRNGGARLMCSLPPRHGKSELLSIGTPQWVMENFPKKRTIISSYSAELSAGFGKKVRDSIIANPDQFSCRINRKASKVSYFETLQGGSVTSVGTGGSITGKGADVFIIDDYFKGPEDAFSQAQRDSLWDWFRTVAMTRLEPGASMIILATRWHSDGLIGKILKEYGEEWEYVCVPGIATEDNDFLGRRKGDALFPERYDIKTLLSRKKELGNAFFEALYQQNPMDEFTKFSDKSWLKTTIALPPVAQLDFVRIWDLAASEAGGDYTTGLLMAIDRKTNFVYLLDMKRVQLSAYAVELLILRTAEEDGENCTVIIEQDPGQSGKAQVSHYEKAVLKDFKVVGIPASKKKVVKAQPFLAAAEAGRVFLYQGAENNFGEWHDKYKEEFDVFPHGPHDDQMDVSAVGFKYLEDKLPKRVAWGRGKSANYGSGKTFQQTLRNIDGTERRSSSIVFGRR